jgi:hypothetical protein
MKHCYVQSFIVSIELCDTVVSVLYLKLTVGWRTTLCSQLM